MQKQSLIEVTTMASKAIPVPVTATSQKAKKSKTKASLELHVNVALKPVTKLYTTKWSYEKWLDHTENLSMESGLVKQVTKTEALQDSFHCIL